MTDTATRPTIVIVHGAWTDASSFADAARMLIEEGYTVLEFANPLRSLAGDSEYLGAFLESRTSGPVVLVGHSYGGALIGAAGLKGGDVRALVYVNAFVPAAGESLLDLLNSGGPVDPTQLFDLVPYPGAPEGDADLFIKREAFGRAFATGLPAGLQAEYYAKQRPITFTAVGAPASGTQAWESLPSWYVAGTADGSIPLALQIRMANRAGSVVTEVDAGHLSMASHPADVTTVIREAAVSAVANATR
jgi:pimeloyl-ACP methyl ester carboxylesterase